MPIIKNQQMLFCFWGRVRGGLLGDRTLHAGPLPKSRFLTKANGEHQNSTFGVHRMRNTCDVPICLTIVFCCMFGIRLMGRPNQSLYENFLPSHQGDPFCIDHACLDSLSREPTRAQSVASLSALYLSSPTVSSQNLSLIHI